MSYSMPDGPTVTIPNGGTDSPAMLMDETVSDADFMVIKSPAALTAATNLQVSYDFDRNYKAKFPQVTLAQATAAANFEDPPAGPQALGGTNVKTRIDLSAIIAVAWRIHSAGAEGADRIFRVIKRTLDTNH